MLRGMIMVLCVFMVRVEMKFVSTSTFIVVLVSVEVMNMLRVMRMASGVEKGMLHRISAGMCASHAYFSTKSMAVIIFSFHYRVTSCEHCRQRAWTMRGCVSSDDAGGC